jgi:hypothetical protein
VKGTTTLHRINQQAWIKIPKSSAKKEEAWLKKKAGLQRARPKAMAT